MIALKSHGLARIVGLVGLTLLFAGAARAELDRYEILRIDRTAFRSDAFAVLPAESGSGIAAVYGDIYGIVRAVRITDRGVQEIWRSRTLQGGAVVQVLVEDLDGRGGADVIARTQQGKVYVYDDRFAARWNSENEDFQRIVSMAIANVDEDPAYELIFVADNQINIYDGDRFQRETKFPETQGNVSDIHVGNVDSDLDLEIVLNTGRVLNAKTGQSEWTTGLFGAVIELLDIDGDGMQEILGFAVGSSQPMRIFDVDERREKPLE